MPDATCPQTLSPADTYRYLLRILGPGKGSLLPSTSLRGPAGSRLSIYGKTISPSGAPKPQPSCLYVSAASPLQTAVEGRSDRRGQASHRATCNPLKHQSPQRQRGMLIHGPILNRQGGTHSQLLPGSSDQRWNGGSQQPLKSATLHADPQTHLERRQVESIKECCENKPSLCEQAAQLPMYFSVLKRP